MARPKKVQIIDEQEQSRPDPLNRSSRPKRQSINGTRNLLSVGGQEPGWHYCWVNDNADFSDGNVQRYINGWYEFVTHPVTVGDAKVDAATQIGGKISKAVGNGVTAYLMRCPLDVYEEELQGIQDEVDSSEETIRGAGQGDGLYGKVKIEQKHVRGNKNDMSNFDS